jgi:hypothetical protein
MNNSIDLTQSHTNITRTRSDITTRDVKVTSSNNTTLSALVMLVGRHVRIAQPNNHGTIARIWCLWTAPVTQQLASVNKLYVGEMSGTCLDQWWRHNGGFPTCLGGWMEIPKPVTSARRIARRSSWAVSLIVENWKVSTNFSKFNTRLSDFMKIHSAVLEVLYADRHKWNKNG